jgi:acyl-CoA thioesterase FadM
MATPAPLQLHHTSVLPDWVDYNGHMNDTYYVLVFSQATDAFMD